MSELLDIITRAQSTIHVLSTFEVLMLNSKISKRHSISVTYCMAVPADAPHYF